MKETSIPYALRRKRFSRVIRIAVYAHGKIVVTAPYLVSRRRIDAFVKERESWILAQIDGNSVATRAAQEQLRRKEYVAQKEEARALVHQLLQELNVMYGLSWNRVSIKCTTSRWGSCSGKRNLNFHYKIVTLAPEIARYLVAHELCHLAHMNHSREFWALVARAVPNYRQVRVALRAVEREMVV